jgi:hypothetical protein
MYLPLLLLDRFGWPGFLVFAIPNVLGCTLMGYVVRRRRSARMVCRHETAMRWFSLITVAFHLHFAGYLALQFLPAAAYELQASTAWIGAPLLLLLGGIALSSLGDRAWLALTGLVYLVSLAAFSALGIEPLAAIPRGGSQGGRDLLMLAPVFGIGFLLCPYLDLTFHRASRTAGSPHAFLAFGIAFVVMILLSCAYWSEPSRAMPFVAAHITAQSLFTVGAHLRELRLTAGPSPARRVAWMAAPLLVLPLTVLAATSDRPTGASDDLYLRFMVFYGLVFPAYVLLFIGPARPLRPTRTALLILGAVVLALAPLYELAFLQEITWVMIVPAAAAAGWLIAGERRGELTVIS